MRIGGPSGTIEVTSIGRGLLNSRKGRPRDCSGDNMNLSGLGRLRLRPRDEPDDVLGLCVGNELDSQARHLPPGGC